MTYDSHTSSRDHTIPSDAQSQVVSPTGGWEGSLESADGQACKISCFVVSPVLEPLQTSSASHTRLSVHPPCRRYPRPPLRKRQARPIRCYLFTRTVAGIPVHYPSTPANVKRVSNAAIIGPSVRPPCRRHPRPTVNVVALTATRARNAGDADGRA